MCDIGFSEQRCVLWDQQWVVAAVTCLLFCEQWVCTCSQQWWKFMPLMWLPVMLPPFIQQGGLPLQGETCCDSRGMSMLVSSLITASTCNPKHQYGAKPNLHNSEACRPAAKRHLWKHRFVHKCTASAHDSMFDESFFVMPPAFMCVLFVETRFAAVC